MPGVPRRLLRYTLDGLTLLSALLCVAVCVLWARGDGAYHDFDGPLDVATPSGVWRRVQVEDGRAGYIRLERPPPGSEVTAAVYDAPAWVLTAALALLPVGRSVAAVGSRHTRCRRATGGLCGTCGYDLRATPHRCPECGAVPERATT